MQENYDDNWTSLRVSKDVRKTINDLARKKNLSVNDLLKTIIKGTFQSTMQIFLDIEPEKVHILNEITKILHSSGAIPKPTVKSSINLAINNLIHGVTKNLEK